MNTESKSLQTTNSSPAMLLQMAVEQGADLDKLEKLMDLQERWEASESRKAYSEAMTLFQSKLERIAKKREGHNSKYADIDDIAQAIRPILDESGLSYRFEQSQGENSITVSCIVTHRLGHHEQTSITAPADTSGGKNAIQAMASSITYLRRYSLTGALGITTGADDNDGGKPEVTVEELLVYNNLLREEFFSVAAVKQGLLEKDYSSAKEAWAELEEQVQRELWKAPTKGGIFTTIERGLMKTPEWAAA
jgi:hypothetical protein